MLRPVRVFELPHREGRHHSLLVVGTLADGGPVRIICLLPPSLAQWPGGWAPPRAGGQPHVEQCSSCQREHAQRREHRQQRPDPAQVGAVGTRAIARPPITTAEVGMKRFMIPEALWNAVTTSSAGTSANDGQRGS